MCSGLTFALAEVSFHSAGPGPELARKISPFSPWEFVGHAPAPSRGRSNWMNAGNGRTMNTTCRTLK